MTSDDGDDDDAIIVIKSWEDLTNRPKFVEQLDPTKKHKLVLLTEYTMPHLIKCGLGDRSDHLHGVLVRTEDGKQETCIGADCAQREFPDQYDALTKRFTARRARIAHLDVINEYLERLPEYERQIDSIVNGERGGHWADRCRTQYDSMCPESVREHLRDLARRSATWTLTEQVRIPDKDKDNDVGLGFSRQQRYEERRVGTLRGGAALRQKVAGVINPLRRAIAEHRLLDAHTMTRPARRKWAEWARSVPGTIDDARGLVAQSRELYTRENLEQLIQIAHKRDRSAVKAFIRSIEAVETTREKAG